MDFGCDGQRDLQGDLIFGNKLNENSTLRTRIQAAYIYLQKNDIVRLLR